ncbi:hypothetical protein JCM10908_006454 [Rhodotorula pacifica]|uniref:TBC domain-containing protein n=1 Tax=Rhodotorula pacifica TaxID=1495444 RepID=UPI003182153C
MAGSSEAGSDNGEPSAATTHHDRRRDSQGQSDTEEMHSINGDEVIPEQEEEQQEPSREGQDASLPASPRRDDNDDDNEAAKRRTHTSRNSDDLRAIVNGRQSPYSHRNRDFAASSKYNSVSSGFEVSLSSEPADHDDRTPTTAHIHTFSAFPDDEDDHDGGGADSEEVHDLAAANTSVSSPPRSGHRRPFSLMSEPDSPSSLSSTLDRNSSPARRPSLLASSLSGSTASADPTNVGRESSASLTQAVWRQSMGLNSNPSALAKGLVDVQLNNEDGEADEDEEAKEARRRKRRSAAMSWNNAVFATAKGNRGLNGLGVKSKRLSTQQRAASEPPGSAALAAAFEEDEEEGESSLAHATNAPGPSSPSSSSSHTRSVSYSSAASPSSSHAHDRSGSISTAIATPHAADGFISHRASANLSSLMQPVSPANPSQSNTGIRALQANFKSLRTLKELGKGGEEGDDEIDWEFWGRVMSDYEEVARSQPKELSRAIQRGIPPALRGMTWQLMSAAKDENLEFVYSELLKQTSPHEKSIARDLNRTFPKHEYFKDAEGVGQENLFNVVKAYSIYDDEVGYTQGLQFIVGPLLLNMPDEEAFCVLVRLMKSYDLRSHYTPNMPGLQLRLFQFDRLVEELVPSVFLHLLRQGVKSSMYASQWFLTLFGYRLPLELVSSVFDLVFAEGVEALFRFAVALLKRNEAYLLTLEFEDLIDFLKNGLFEAYAPDERELMRDPDAGYRVHEFVREALQVRITPMMLDQFGEEWASLCAAQTAHAAELDALRQANHQLSRQVRQLESSLAQINLEHCDLVKQVVAARLEREELEDELVKYKLAYADLSHVAAASQASASPVSSRRQSEMSIASVSDESRSSTSNGPVSAGLTAGLGSFGGRWFGGSGRGSVSSTMSHNGSQGA